MICTAHSHVMFQAPKGRELGTNIRHGQLKDGILHRLLERVIQIEGSTLMDIDPQALGAREPAILAGTPIHDEYGTAIAVLAAVIPVDRINELMHQVSSSGVADNTYLVGPDKLMRSD